MRLLFFILFPSLLFAQGDYEKVRSNFRKMEKLGFTGEGVKVAILDYGFNRVGVRGEDETWVDYTYGYDFTDDDTSMLHGSHHGQFCLSIIRSSIGLAPDAKVYALKVIADGEDIPTEEALLAAMNYCIDSSVDIVSMSFTYDSEPFQTKINEMLAAGIVIVAASGNDGSPTFTLKPAALPGVIAVNDINASGGEHDHNVNPPASPEGAHGITIAASGVACEVIGKTGVLVTSSGTSFSAPFIVGTFALYKQRYPTMSNNAVMQLILDRAIKQTNTLYFGAGRPTF